MVDVTHLSRAPIKEALIDIKVERRPGISADDIAKATERLQDRFPQITSIQRNRLDLRIDVGKDPVTNVGSALHGYRFASDDGQRITQFQLDGFTFNWLEPYETWERLHEQAREAWYVYTDVTKPLAVTRLGVRYINRLALPQPLGTFEEYLVSPPSVPSNLPQTVKSFLSRIVIHDGDLGADCILTQAMEGVDPNHEQVPVFLDIDTIVNRRFALTDNFWSTVSELRDFKNRVFFRSITEKTVELFT